MKKDKYKDLRKRHRPFSGDENFKEVKR